MKDFKKLSCTELDFNVFEEIGKKMLLITASDSETGRLNAMTASWGMMGILWNKPVCALFIRPQRFTKPLVDGSGLFSVNVLSAGHGDAYRICGTLSGRDNDKITMSKLTPFETDGVFGFEESETVLVLKKLYQDEIGEGGFIDKGLLSNYSAKDYHAVYVCEIVAAYHRA